MTRSRMPTPPQFRTAVSISVTVYFGDSALNGLLLQKSAVLRGGGVSI